MRLHDDSKFNSLVESHASGTGGTAVEWVDVRQLDQTCRALKLDRIDLLKTDTEGYDLEVLQGASRLLAEQRITLVLAEVSFAGDTSRHTPFPPLQGLLQDYGFDLVGFYHQSHFRRLSTLDYCDALFIQPEAASGLLRAQAA